MNRRGFLAAILAAAAAPAIVKAANLMPVVARRPSGVLVHDDLVLTFDDFALSLDEFSRRVLEPAMQALARKMDADILRYAYTEGEWPKVEGKTIVVLDAKAPKFISVDYRLRRAA